MNTIATLGSRHGRSQCSQRSSYPIRPTVAHPIASPMPKPIAWPRSRHRSWPRPVTSICSWNGRFGVVSGQTPRCLKRLYERRPIADLGLSSKRGDHLHFAKSTSVSLDRREVVMAGTDFPFAGSNQIVPGDPFDRYAGRGRRWLFTLFSPYEYFPFLKRSMVSELLQKLVERHLNRVVEGAGWSRPGYPSDFGEGFTAERRHSDPAGANQEDSGLRT